MHNASFPTLATLHQPIPCPTFAAALEEASGLVNEGDLLVTAQSLGFATTALREQPAAAATVVDKVGSKVAIDVCMHHGDPQTTQHFGSLLMIGKGSCLLVLGKRK